MAEQNCRRIFISIFFISAARRFFKFLEGGYSLPKTKTQVLQFADFTFQIQPHKQLKTGLTKTIHIKHTMRLIVGTQK